MKKPGFGVTTFVVCLLVLAGLIAKALEPILPAPPSNRMAKSDSYYLRQGAREDIDWRPIGPEAFSDAKRLGKPILMVVGTPWSRWGRQADDNLFRDEEIVRMLGRHFICIRIDGSTQPTYFSCFLPLTRLEQGLLPGFQVWFLDPSGRLIDSVLRTVQRDAYSRAQFLGALADARRLYEGELKLTVLPETRQQRETQRIREAGGTTFLPPADAYLDALRRQIDPRWGGFLTGPILVPRPLAWRYFLVRGDAAAFKRAVDPLLLSPLFDWQDGGFFRQAELPDYRDIQFDKVSVDNAEWLHLLAVAAMSTGSSTYREFARRTFDALLDDLSANERIAVCRVGDEMRNRRSVRASISQGDLNGLFSPSERAWMVSELMLDPWRNAPMVPRLRAESVLLQESETLDRLMAKLRVSSRKPPLAEFDSADTNAYCLARMLDAARLLGDEDRRDRVIARIERLRRFRVGDDVLSRTVEGVRTPFLGDYLSYADAMLSDYVVNGRVPSIESGAAVLDRALFLFQAGSRGEYVLAANLAPGGPADIRVPQIADELRESLTAQLIRLCHRYSRLLAGTPRERAFRDAAFAALGQFSALVGAESPLAAGFYLAAGEIQDDRYALAVGPNAVELAARLARARPSRFVAPAIDAYRADLQARGPGFYVIRDGETLGPLDERGALSAL